MKKLLTMLFFLIVSLGAVFKPELAFTAESNDKIQEAKHFDYDWSGNEEELYLNLDLLDNLSFADKYQTSKIKNGQVCKVSVKLPKDQEIFSEKGDLLKSMELTVAITNNENPAKINYLITAKSSYKGTDEEGYNISTTLTTDNKGSLKNPTIDLTKRPVFFTINDEDTKGVISFQNAFPYSDIEKK